MESYRDCSKDLIHIINREDYDEMERRLAERQELLDSIGKLEFSKEELKIIVEELNIIPLSEQIEQAVMEKKLKINKLMQSTVASKNANNKYNSSSLGKTHVFSKKV